MEAMHQIELVGRRVSPALEGLVAGVVGLSERACGVVRRRQPAGTLLPLVLSFGNPLTVDSLADATGAGRAYGSFMAGLSTGPADTWFVSGQDCVQVYLTPIGVRRILGVPGAEVARRVVACVDVLPAMGDSFTDRLHTAATWQERLGLVEESLIRQAVRNADPPGWVAWMWNQIRKTGGQVRIGDLVTATGFSHRHVASVFGEQMGLTPKQAAGLVRFEAAASDLGRLPLAELAVQHGYVDQSHFSRDVARYAGETPGELLAARRPTPATALAAC
jgi:AraC-like DNA-binding protein